MPAAVPLIAAVAGAVATSATAAALGAIGSALFGAVVTFAISALGQALFGAKKREPEQVDTPAGRELQVRESAAPRRVVIGRVKVSGPTVLLHARDADGVANKFLYIGVVLAAHECQGVGSDADVFLDDLPITDPKFAGLWRYEVKNGLPDQTAIGWVVDEINDPDVWGADHRLRGCCYIIVRLTYSDSAFPGGAPSVSVILRGKKLFDPRTGSTTYSNNAALAVSDYLLSPFGFATDAEDIDPDSWAAAANLCDERIPLASGGTERRFTANGTYELSEAPGRILEKLLTASAGAAVNAGGTWFIEPAAWRPSNAVVTPDWLRGPLDITENRPQAQKFNTVRATYIRPDAEWQETDAPVRVDAAAKAEDGNEEISTDLDLPFTTSGFTAQRLMKIAQGRNRAGQPVAVVLPCKLHALSVRPGQVVGVDLPRRPRVNMRITTWELADDMAGVTMTAEADNPDIYTWSVSEEQPLLAPGANNAPGGTSALTPTLTLTAPAAPLPTSIAASWTAVSGALDYELSWRTAPTGEFTATVQAGTSATIATGGRAAMKVRARKEEGFSEYDTALLPPALTRLVVAGTPGGLAVEWSGSDAVQIFTGTTDVFADATLAASPSVPGGVTVSIAAGPYFVWARAVSAKGAVGEELGPVEAIAEDPASGGSTGSEAGGGGTGETEGPGSGGPSGGSAGAG